MQLKVNPEFLVEFGLIPEFIGRLPVMVTLDQLDRDALIQILTKPKNALTKQYEKINLPPPDTIANVLLQYRAQLQGFQKREIQV